MSFGIFQINHVRISPPPPPPANSGAFLEHVKREMDLLRAEMKTKITRELYHGPGAVIEYVPITHNTVWDNAIERALWKLYP